MVGLAAQGALQAGVGTAVGALGSRLAQGKTGHLMRKYIRGQVEGLDKGPDDARAAADQAQMGAISNQVLGAQQQMLNQAAMNQGPVAAGAMASSARDIGGAGQDAAVKATSEADRLRKAMQAQRVARIENLGFKGAELAQQDAAFGAGLAMDAMSTLPKFGGEGLPTVDPADEAA